LINLLNYVLIFTRNFIIFKTTKMVKNQGGGKHKHLKRDSDGFKAKEIQKSQCPDELYCIVEKVLGNGMFHGRCEDDVLRLGHIPGKFRGFGKKDNLIVPNVWVLVGLRSYETVNPKKLPNCDLLCVYSDAEKDTLKRSVNKNWSLFISLELKSLGGGGGAKMASEDNIHEAVVFGDPRVSEYESLIQASSSKLGEAVETISGSSTLTLLDVADI
jgi:initiation factor 1A